MHCFPAFSVYNAFCNPNKLHLTLFGATQMPLRAVLAIPPREVIPARSHTLTFLSPVAPEISLLWDSSWDFAKGYRGVGVLAQKARAKDSSDWIECL